MTERWKKPFGYANIHSISENAVGGVYGFWHTRTRRCLYVGHTKRPIKERLMEYWSGADKHNPALNAWLAGAPDLVEICYLEVKADIMRIRRMEDLLIYVWSPETNVIQNRRRKNR